MKKQLTIWGLAAVMMCGMNSCSCRSAHDDDADRQREEGTERGDVIPQKSDYGDASQWYSVNRGGTGDLFYITSTETGDYLLSDGTMCHYADTYRDSLRLPLTSEMEGVDQILSGGLNFYAPYYRQCSLQSFTSDSLTAARLPLATADVRQALDYYLKHINTNRPFILAGFSQGALIVLELLGEMDEAVYRRMAAAYIIGAPSLSSSSTRMRTSSLRRDLTIRESPSATTPCAMPRVQYGPVAPSASTL